MTGTRVLCTFGESHTILQARARRFGASQSRQKAEFHLHAFNSPLELSRVTNHRVP